MRAIFEENAWSIERFGTEGGEACREVPRGCDQIDSRLEPRSRLRLKLRLNPRKLPAICPTLAHETGTLKSQFPIRVQYEGPETAITHHQHPDV